MIDSKVKRKLKVPYWCELCFVFFLSIAVMYVMTGFNPNVFLVDDNYTQFYPIIQKSFDTFLEEGRLPIYDFYQMKGMIIADQGYYGQTNGLLFFSYLLSKFIFTSVNLIGIYAFLCVAIGNMGLYILLRKLKCEKISAVLCFLMLSASSAFFSYGYWYYIFGNYFIVPYLILASFSIFLEKERKISYGIAGIILFISLLLGNIQYTFFHYLLFFVFSLVSILLTKNNTKIKMVVSNLMIGITLSSPFILLQLHAGTRRSASIGEEFLLYPNYLLKQFILSFMPVPLMKGLFGNLSWFDNFINNGSFVNNGFDFYFCGFLFLFLILYVFIIYCNLFIYDIKILKKELNEKRNFQKFIWYKVISFFIIVSFTEKVGISLLITFLFFLIELYLCGQKKAIEEKKEEEREKNDNYMFFHIIFLCILFFLILGLGKGYIIADILAQIPVIREFRYLFKTIFVLLPLLSILAAVLFQYLKKYRRVLYIFAGWMLIIGIYNNYYMTTSGTHRFYQKQYLDNNLLEDARIIKEYCQNYSIDTKNYRMCTFLENKGGTDFWSHYSDSFLSKKIVRNIPTLFEIYTLGGYDTALMEKSYYQSNHLLIQENFCYSWTNGIASAQFFEQCKNEEFITNFIDEIIKNNVKYILFNRNSEYIDLFNKIISDNKKINIVKMIDVWNDMVLVELDGIDGICCREVGNILPESKLDEIIIEINHQPNQVLDLSFTYYPNIEAYYQKGEEKVILETEENEKGCIRILCNNNWEENKLHIMYKDHFSQITLMYLLYFSLIALVLLALFVVKLIKECKE